ncbi:MAG: ribose-5-phosphate isomerase RpiA [Gemmatimonadales bacterium]|nr:MAG: ribose-5-phosphate isomerase RpiA [Gemmatimonadales bacterium]
MEGTESAKELAGRHALNEVRSGMTLGLGTGSTVRWFLEALGEALREDRLRDIRGVPTSVETEERCRQLRIPLVTLPEAGRIDVAVDGADEVDPSLDLVKGLGGALLREKMVVQAAERFVVIVDPGKLVRGLGRKAPLPVEVVPFGWEAHLRFFRGLGSEPELRRVAGEPFVSDNGNYIVDLSFSNGIPDPEALDRALAHRAGVVESGLFLGVADRIILGEAGKPKVLDRTGRTP